MKSEDLHLPSAVNRTVRIPLIMMRNKYRPNESVYIKTRESFMPHVRVIRVYEIRYIEIKRKKQSRLVTSYKYSFKQFKNGYIDLSDKEYIGQSRKFENAEL